MKRDVNLEKRRRARACLKLWQGPHEKWDTKSAYIAGGIRITMVTQPISAGGSEHNLSQCSACSCEIHNMSYNWLQHYSWFALCDELSWSSLEPRHIARGAHMPFHIVCPSTPAPHHLLCVPHRNKFMSVENREILPPRRWRELSSHGRHASAELYAGILCRTDYEKKFAPNHSTGSSVKSWQISCSQAVLEYCRSVSTTLVLWTAS